jgi:hypothetical protein
MPPKPKTTDLNRALARVSNPPKTGPQKNKPKRLPQKKRTSASHNRTRKVKEETNLAHITKAIVREGGTVADVGIILGCAAAGGEQWLAELKAKGLSVAEFMEIAKTRADIDLIRVAVKAATGYGYEEESQEYTPRLHEDEETGKITALEGEYIPGKKTIKKRHQSADTTLLKFLLSSRMPEFFMDRKEITIDKRTVVELRETAKAEITGFCSGLMKSLGGEVIEAEFVEKTSE